MSEGERPPGPFIGLPGTRTLWRETEESVRSADYIATAAPQLDEAEFDELVDLLNKGTHYDAMLEALKLGKQAMDHALLSAGPSEGGSRVIDNNHPALRQMRAVIAECERATG